MLCNVSWSYKLETFILRICKHRMVELYNAQKDFILASGSGIKTCLFDKSTMPLLNSLIPYSELQANDFFYFDFLGNKSRMACTGLSCVVLISSSSLTDLIAELSNPSYSRYSLLFIDPIEEFALEIIANSDNKNRVECVYELFINMVVQYDGMYLSSIFDTPSIFTSLRSVLMSLEIFPRILTLHVNEYQGIAKELENYCESHSLKKNGTLIILKRSFDLISPLMADWHYNALIEELFRPVSGIIQIGIEKLTIFDEFYTKNCFESIHVVGERIKELGEKLKENKSRIMSGEFQEIKEKAEHASMARTHLKLQAKITEKCKEYRETCDAEIVVVRNDVVDINKLLKGKTEMARLKILLIYFCKHVRNWDEESKRFPKERNALLEFYQMYKPAVSHRKANFNPEKDTRLGYEPALKRMLRNVIKKREVFTNLKLISGGMSRNGPIIVYIDGGASMNEYRAVNEIANKYNQEVLLLSDKIFRSSDVISELMTKHCAKLQS